MWVQTHFKLCNVGSVASKIDLLVTTCLYFESGIGGDS